MRSSMTRLHSRGESTPPCGHPLAADAPRVSPDNVALIFLLSSIAQIHLHIAGSIPCLSATCFIMSKEVLSKASLYIKECSKGNVLVFDSILNACYHVMQCGFSRSIVIDQYSARNIAIFVCFM
jgi:hypothetical protein